MTDLQFLELLKKHLLHLEQVLVQDEIQEVDAAVRDIQQFIHESKRNPPTKSGEVVRPLAEEINEVLLRSQVLIREGLHMNQVLMQLFIDQRPATTGNYQKPNVSTEQTPHTPSQRMFDARV